MAIRARIPVRIYYDKEARNWHFDQPDLHVLGGGQRTRHEARQAAASAIAFALGTGPTDPGDAGRCEYIDITITARSG